MPEKIASNLVKTEYRLTSLEIPRFGDEETVKIHFHLENHNDEPPKFDEKDFPHELIFVCGSRPQKNIQSIRLFRSDF